MSADAPVRSVAMLRRFVGVLLEQWTWARKASIGTVRPGREGGFEISFVRSPVRLGLAMRGAWARVSDQEVSNAKEELELLELVTSRVLEALAQIGLTPMKRKTVWIRNRWCVTAVYSP